VGELVNRAALALAAALLVAGAGSLSGQPANAGLVLRGATIYTARDAAPIRDGVVIVRAGKIAAIGARAAVTLPAGMPVRDLTGLTLVAGFRNSHVHFSGPQ
jgi:predicted amidohydrolase YtcJ